MDKHGVTFKDYACASANLAAGMQVTKICEILGIEEPLWAEVQEFWNNEMANMSFKDMDYFGKVFSNPKQGKFANVEESVGGVEEVLKKYPEWSDAIKMEKYMEHTSNAGFEVDFDKEFGISLTQYSQLTGHWSVYFKDKVMDRKEGNDEATRVLKLHDELRNKWDKFYREKFADQGTNLSDDIDF